MNSFTLKALKTLNRRIKKWIDAADNQPEITEHISRFHSLSPIKDADVTQYTAALSWALDNRQKESIYNIALSGPYGSGKSSILQTFKAGNVNTEYQFLEISLATFKDEIQTEGAEEEPAKEGENKKPGNDEPVGRKKNDDVLRLIELSILQQIFYHEEDKKIPDSRFKKIRSFKSKSLRLITTGTILAIVFGINLFLPEKIEKILEVDFIPLVEHILHWISLAVFIAAMALAIYRSIRLVYGLKISKFKFQEAEIEIDKNISKSILNNHLDEILYFFEVTKYSVVYIEDLDRFRQAEIFTKLRELNLLINKSKKVEQDVVFIYAVRDEMFTDKDRTKFFDFIIPVIPVINSSNSNDKLIKLVTDNKYSISNDLIDDVSYFIDDMRLLFNITNEYSIYSSLLDGALNQDRLLAMVVYKNIFPDDFVLLHEGQGKLFNLIQKRSEYVNTAIKKLDVEIQENKKELLKIQRTQLKHGDELRLLYVSKFVDKTDGFRYFNFNGSPVNLEGAAKEGAFEYFQAGNFNYLLFYHQHGSYYANNANADFKFEGLEKEVDDEQTYKERLEHVNSQGNDGEEIIKREIQRLEKQKVSVRHAKLQDLLKEPKPKIAIDKTTKQDQLLNILLTSGYINEDYLDYISLFYEGSISKSDRAFLLNVKSQTATDFDFKLVKIDNLIGKIRPVDFQFNYIFNYDLLDFLLVNDSFPAQRDAVFNQLMELVDEAPAFMDGFVTNGTNIEAFISQLAKKWSGLWKYISEKSLFPAEKIYNYFRLLILNADSASLEDQAVDSNLKRMIAEDSQFLSLSPDHEIIQNVIGFFNIKFIEVPLDKGNKSMSDFIYQGKFFAINIKMVTEVIKYAGNFNQMDFDQKNYHAIRNAGVAELASYIDESINNYMQEVYFKLPNNKYEAELDFISLLDNTEINVENLEKLISGIETKITDLCEVSNTLTDDMLFEHNKINATWNNLAYYKYRHDDTLGEQVTTFLNVIENATALSEEKLNAEVLFGDEENAKGFLNQVIHLEKVDDANFRLITHNFPDDFMVAEMEGISNEKMEIFIQGGHLYADSKNFIDLKEHFKPLRLLFLEKTVEAVLAYLDDYELDVDDIKFIVKSNAFSKEQKRRIINTVDKGMLLKSHAMLLDIGAYIVTNYPFPVDKSVLIGALQQSLPIDDRVRLFNMHYKEFQAADIPIIFQTFPYDFMDIGKLTFSPVISETTENRFLANNLLERKFIANVKDEKRGIRIINFKKAKI